MEVRTIEENFLRLALFQGMMNVCANSIELVLGDIFKKTGISSPDMLGQKIGKLKENKPNLSRYTVNFEELIEKLDRFNKNWNISKHGMMVHGKDVKDITLWKDGFFHVFDKEKIEHIRQEFTQIQQVLGEIHKKL